MKTSFLFLLLLTAVGMQGQYIWDQKADIPTKGCFQSAFVIGDMAYAGLGCLSFSAYQTTDKFYKYDPSSDTWTPVATFPGGGRYGATSFAVNGKGYVCFGRDDAQVWNKEVWEYDPATDTWTRKNDFPGQPRYESTGFAVDGFGYIAGGSINEGYNYLNDTWKYDPVMDLWTRLPDMPVAHSCASAGVTLDGKGYILGGMYNTVTGSNDNREFDPALNVWNQLPGFPEMPRRDPAAFILEGQIFCGTGMNPDPSSIETFSSFWAYDPAAADWYSVAGLPVSASPRVGATGFSIGLAGYIVGGLTAFPPASGIVLGETWSFRRYLGLGEPGEGGFSLFPNPAADYITMRMKGDFGNGCRLRIADLTGREVYACPLATMNGQAGIDLTGLAEGIYVVMVMQQESCLFRDKMVIRR
jgi:N-acetylneuraminic acid mutarotase